MTDQKKIKDFVSYVVNDLKGDEKGEKDIYWEALFRAFGHPGFHQAGGIFEARVKTASGSTDFIDALWAPLGRSGVLIEMKARKEKNLEKYFEIQAKPYWLEMQPQKILGPGAQKPRYIILCNFDKFIIYDQLNKVDELTIDELPSRWTALNFLLPEEREPIFKCNTREISEQAARQIGELYQRLVYEKGCDPEVAQRFILQCVVALFSEDTGILPEGFFTQIIQDCQKKPSESYDLIGGLFRQMASSRPATGGRYKSVPYFNGGLFEKVDPIELDPDSLKLLIGAAHFDWKSINPAIFGGLFEGTMNQKKRHEFGAHFTHAEDIQKIVYPTITRPWMEKIKKANSVEKLEKLWNELANFRILDPACGCGNFLFIAFQELKELEMRIIEKIYQLSQKKAQKMNIGGSRISTTQIYGIDILPMAVELAKVTLMIAKEIASLRWNQWIQTLKETNLNFSLDDCLPLENLDENIVCRDALLEPWPEFDCVIGNPPFQSKNKMAEEMDRDYIGKIRKKFPKIPGRADLCVYWFHKAHTQMKEGQRAGLVGTNTIRQNYSREGGLDYIIQNGGTITDAVSSQKWRGEAVVYVSIVNWIKGITEFPKILSLQKGDAVDSPFEFFDLDFIGPSLSSELDVSQAKKLMTNANSPSCFQGQTHGNAGFLLPIEEAKILLRQNPKYKEVLFPFLIGEELLTGNSLPKRFVIDFRKNDIFEAASYKALYEIIEKKVYSDIEKKASNQAKKNQANQIKNTELKVNHHHENHFKTWWQLKWKRNELMDILETIPRYITCSCVTKRPIFEFISSKIHPNAALQIFPLADNYSFGILQSSIHFEWFKARCSTLKGDSRYTSNTVFDSFPWPQTPKAEDIRAVAETARKLALKRREIMKENQLSLRDLYRMMEKTPKNPVSEIQHRLDDAVRRAYGMKRKDDPLEFLLCLNLALAEKEKQGETVRAPGFPRDIISKIKPFITPEAVKMQGDYES